MAYLVQNRGFSSAKKIAKEELMPEDFLEKILVRLKSAGLVKARHGSGGGYSLAIPSSRITVGDIVRPLEGKMTLTLCLDRKKGFSCPHEKGCLTKKIWLRIQNLLNQSMDEILLSEVIS
ncbi:Rrf2 family transcriptional regulator [Patescibacteria group bacterium]|nr:Rrf2 family transcriptional regulator [Patescibacteria group bacterium]